MCLISQCGVGGGYLPKTNETRSWKNVNKVGGVLWKTQRFALC